MDRGVWKAAVHGVAEGRTQLSDVTFTFHFQALEKAMATHSSVLAWRIPGMGEPGGLPSMGFHRVGHDWSDLAAAAEYWCSLDVPACFLWRVLGGELCIPLMSSACDLNNKLAVTIISFTFFIAFNVISFISFTLGCQRRNCVSLSSTLKCNKATYGIIINWNVFIIFFHKGGSLIMNTGLHAYLPWDLSEHQCLVYRVK